MLTAGYSERISAGDFQLAWEASRYQDRSDCSANECLSQKARNVRFEMIRNRSVCKDTKSSQFGNWYSDHKIGARDCGWQYHLEEFGDGRLKFAQLRTKYQEPKPPSPISKLVFFNQHLHRNMQGAVDLTDHVEGEFSFPVKDLAHATFETDDADQVGLRYTQFSFY